MDVLAHGHFEHNPGQVTGDIAALSRLFGFSETTECEGAISEIERHKVGDVKRHRNGDVTLINRRVARQEKGKENNKVRQQNHRDKKDRNADVTSESGDRNADVTSENAVPSSSFSSSSSKDKKRVLRNTPKENGIAERPVSVSQQVWDDFLIHRKGKKAPVTVTALKGIASEATKADLTLEEALTICCQCGWQGFRADWWKRRTRNEDVGGKSSREEYGTNKTVVDLGKPS